MAPDDALDHVTSPDAIPPRAIEPEAREHTEEERGLVGQVVGSYRVTGKLGRGSVGVVYEAQHQTIGGRVAIKVLDTAVADSPVVAGRFEQEARAANKVANTHIARALDFGQLPDGRHYTVYEFVDGPPLEKVLQDGPMEVRRAMHIAGQVAEAMSAAHAVGVVHRDLKPANILLDTKPELGGEFVRVLDFGVAKLLGDASKTNYTAAGVFIGTPRYCAPEQLTGEWPIGPAADIYALGAVLYEMLAGRPAFRGRLADIAIKKTHREVEPLKQSRRELTDELCRLVDQMLDPDPHGRPPSMNDVARSLREIRDRKGGSAWGRWAVIGLGALLVFAATFALVRWKSSATPMTPAVDARRAEVRPPQPPTATPPVLPPVAEAPTSPTSTARTSASPNAKAPVITADPVSQDVEPKASQHRDRPSARKRLPRVSQGGGISASATSEKEAKKAGQSGSVDIVNPFSPRKDTRP